MTQSPINKFSNSNVALYGMFVSVMLVVSYLESQLPLPFPIPGIKIGLANIVTLWILYAMNLKSAIIISSARIFIAGFLFGNLYSIMFSLVGGMLSLGIMILLKYTKKFSITGVSIAGAVAHNFGQIIVAIIVLENSRIAYYLPFLIISGVVFGILIGVIASIIYKKIKILQTNVHM